MSLMEYKTKGLQLSHIREALPFQISDAGYSKFLLSENGGFYFDKALVLYGLSPQYSITQINALLHDYYQDRLGKYQCIGCDIFGNQFVLGFADFSWFNIETGIVEFIASDFEEGMRTVVNDADFFTGRATLNVWEKLYGVIGDEERLAAKIPFATGGEYTPDNLYVEKFEKLIAYNSFIAKTLHDLPDGTEVAFVVTE